MQLAMINDQIVPYIDLDPAYLDRGTFFGDGVYEVIRSYNSNIFALDDHLERLGQSLDKIKITGIDIDSIRQKVLNTFEKTDIQNAKIYFHITRGSETRKHASTESLKPNFFMTITDLPDDSKAKTNGIAVCTCPDLRWKRCDIKSLNLLPNILARIEAEEKNCDEAIFVDENGLITEGAGSSFFGIFGNTLQTAPLTANILPSITRKYVIKAAKKLGMKIAEQSLTPQHGASPDELFLAITTKDIVPVVKFDSYSISNDKPGPKTKKLIETFKTFVAKTV
ncbi:MAG: aminotransferase class IV [Planctomycetota bacterium]|jgi:D-alanine transaminase